MDYSFGNKIRFRTAIAVLLILMAGLVAGGPLNHLLGGSLPMIHPVYAALGPANNLGIDCALGSSADAPNPFPTPIATKDSDGVIDSNCQWAGDVDADPVATLDPLTSDSPEALSPQIGGGFITDVIFTNMNVTINGFDITVNYDPHILDFVAFDQSGLTFGGNVGCPSSNPQCTLQLAASADHVNGVVRLAQVVLGLHIGPNGDTGNINSVALFRLRFDVVGAGFTPIHFGTNIITLVIGTATAPDPHYTFDASFSTQDIFNLLDSQPLAPSTAWFNASWSFSPSPEVPSAPLTFTATASCSYCKGSLIYHWDFSSVDSSGYTPKIDRSGNVVTITAPPPLINRVTLTVTNASGTVSVSATRLLPLVAKSPLHSLSVGVAGDVGGSWLGGIPSYSGSYALCPAQSSSDTTVCSKPTFVIPLGTTSENKTAIVSYNYAGLYNSTLTITDSAPSWVSGPSTAATTFLVNVTGTPMVYTLGISSNETVAFVSHAVQLTATVAYSSNYPGVLRSTSFRYVFFFGDGTSQIISSGTSASVSHIYLTNAKFNVLVRAQETRTTILSKSRIQENGYTIMAVDAPITADFTPSPPTVQSGQTITFTATASGGTSTFTYSWAFGDGTTGAGLSVTHTYSNTGTYNVNLTITDSYGGTSVVTHSVTVTSTSPTPPSSPFPLAYVAGAGIGGAAILAALVLLIRRRRKGMPSPV